MKACIDIGGTKVAVGLAADTPAGAAPPPIVARQSEPTA